MHSIKEVFLKYKPILKNVGIDTFSLDIDILLMEALGFTKEKLYTNTDYILSENEYTFFKTLFKRRLKKEPIAYITKKCEFMGLMFSLNYDTLIPRPDTEILVQKVIDIINNKNMSTCIDIGTGSGAIAISIAKYCQNIKKITAVDINYNALSKAKQNAIQNNVSHKIDFVLSNLFDNINQKFDMIVSNPPYIKTKDILTLDENVKNFEPHLALDGGEDGLLFYKKIIKKANLFLNNNSYILLEIGSSQANEVKNIMLKYDFKNINILKDLAGLDRVIFANNGGKYV